MKAAPPEADLKTAESGETPRRIKVLRTMAFIIVPSLFVAFLAIGTSVRSGSQDLVGEQAPDFKLPLLSGGTLDSERLKGSPVVINFWASWCTPCREEAPVLEAKWQEYKDDGIKVIGVNVQDSLSDAKAFTSEFGLTFPSVRDRNLDLYNAFGVRGLPETFFIDHTWTFRGLAGSEQTGHQGTFKILGAIEPATLDRQIRRLLELQGSD